MRLLLETFIPSALVFGLAGLPWAIAVRERSEGWFRLGVDSLAFGAVYVSVIISLYSWIGLSAPILGAALFVAVIVWALIRRAGLPRLTRPTRAGWIFGSVAVIVAVVAFLLRAQLVNFILWIGDFGGYTNWADSYARTGELSAQWPPLFSSYLVVSTLIGGARATGADVPILGMLFIGVVAVLLLRLRLNRWIVLLVAAVMTLQVHAVWYSTLTASEAFAAPLTVLSIALVIGFLRAPRHQLPPWVFLAFLVTVAAGLLRGTGPLLVVPVLAAALCFALAGASRAPRMMLLVGAQLAGASLTYWYGVSKIPSYYVDAQMRTILPSRIMGILDRTGLDRPTPTTAIVLLAATVLIPLAGLGIHRVAVWLRASRVPRRPFEIAAAMLLGAALTVILIGNAVSETGVSDIVGRIGVVLVVAALLGLVLSVIAPGTGDTRLVALLSGTVAVLFLVLQTGRLTDMHTHIIYLYWDRYLVSEFLPCVFILTGLFFGAVASMVLRVRAAGSHRTMPRAAALGSVAVGVAVVVVAGFAVAPSIEPLRTARSNTMLNSAYDLQAQLASDFKSTGATASIWTTQSGAEPAGYFFPNLWFSFGQPLKYTFGITQYVEKPITSDFAADPETSLAFISSALGCAPNERIVVFELANPGASLPRRVASDRDISAHLLAQRRASLPILQTPIGTGWRVVNFKINVWEVEDSRPANTPCTLPGG